LAVAAHFVVVGLVQPLLRPYVYSDFVTFDAASRCFARGVDPYDDVALRAASPAEWRGWVGGYLYPPPFAAAIVRPLAALPFESSRRIWVLLECAAFGAAALRLATRTGAAAPLFVAIALAFAPMWFDLRLGSVSGCLLLLVVTAEHERERGHLWRAAFALAGAILLKLAPVLVALYWLVRGERRLAWRSAATLAGLVLVFSPWTGLESYSRYAHAALPRLAGQSFSWFSNQSLDAAFGRLLLVNPDTTPWVNAPHVQRALVVAVSLAIVAALGVASRRTRRLPPGDALEGLIAASVLAATPLLARVAWEYLVVLALPLGFAWARCCSLRTVTRGEAAAFALAWLACAAPWPYYEHIVRAGPGLLLGVPRTVGLLAALAVVFVHARRRTSH
jgi:hypothetical protein